MESPPIFKLGFLDQAGNPLAGPVEWRTAWIEMDIAQQDWEHVRLVRQMYEELQVSLKRLGGSTRVVAEWPLSGPGHYRLQLCIHDKLVAVEPSVVTIQP